MHQTVLHEVGAHVLHEWHKCTILQRLHAQYMHCVHVFWLGNVFNTWQRLRIKVTAAGLNYGYDYGLCERCFV